MQTSTSAQRTTEAAIKMQTAPTASAVSYVPATQDTAETDSPAQVN